MQQKDPVIRNLYAQKELSSKTPKSIIKTMLPNVFRLWHQWEKLTLGRNNIQTVQRQDCFCSFAIFGARGDSETIF